MKKIFNIALVCMLAVGFAACAGKPAADGASGDGKAPKADYEVRASGETVRIEIAANGYTPKTIGVRKGQTVKLEFFRKDGDNCGEKLVFPAMNIERDIPVGKPVVVEVTPDKAGELKFACGMDMLRGKLIVSD